MPESWDTLVVMVTNSAPDKKVTMEMANDASLNEEARRTNRESGSSQALAIENRGRSREKVQGFRGRSKSKNRSKSRDPVKRNHCGKVGHLKRNCKLLKQERKDGKSKKNSEEESNVTVVVSDEETVSLICGHGDCNHVTDPSNEWIVDTGATYHCVPKRELFTTYKAGDFSETRMGNKSVSQIVGIGDIVVQTMEDDASPNLWHNRLAQVSFRIPATRKENKLELIHSDVCGPMEMESLGDNGGEYTFNDFATYCSKHGIRHELTEPGTPQHNGVAERMNRTIVERVRCMLRMAKLPKAFWGEAVKVACYLINRSPSAPLGFDIPKKVWLGKDPSYAHLKVFGCKTFLHVLKEQRSKLDSKATPCIFVGYGGEEFGYRFWDPEKKNIVRNRDVVFHEHETIADFEKKEKTSWVVHDDDDLTSTTVPPRRATNDAMGIEQGEQPPLLENNEPQLRRSAIGHIPSIKYPSSEFLLLTDDGELESFRDVQSTSDKQRWLEAMQEEMDSLKKNGTYELVELPKGKMPLKNKWVFKLKKDGNKLVRYKARLVVKGFAQKVGIDFDEIFSPVVKMCSIRVVLGLTASLNLEIEQLDVKIAFLHGDLQEEIYMDQPEGFEVKGKEHMDAKSVSTPLANHFKLTKKSCPVSEKEKDEMSVIPYSSAMGSVMYLMVCTRPNITHAVGVVSRFLSDPGKVHWEAVKWIFRYLRGTSKMCLSFGTTQTILEGFTDADMAGDLDSRKSTSGYIFTFAGGAISWQSKLQKCVALSTTEAEYIAAIEAGYSSTLINARSLLKAPSSGANPTRSDLPPPPPSPNSSQLLNFEMLPKGVPIPPSGPSTRTSADVPPPPMLAWSQNVHMGHI
ncbi:Integrase, catalytic core [Corchorus capsularis]|uniref:Integrase, catalytic core n=1 Tax=Corchorus capsularis TaxID=210143 RepID=A0A1R3GMH5_COCAP|nr:Integrase, catalytic core [Corchorus capsularis]